MMMFWLLFLLGNKLAGSGIRKRDVRFSSSDDAGLLLLLLSSTSLLASNDVMSDRRSLVVLYFELLVVSGLLLLVDGVVGVLFRFFVSASIFSAIILFP